MITVTFNPSYYTPNHVKTLEILFNRLNWKIVANQTERMVIELPETDFCIWEALCLE